MPLSTSRDEFLHGDAIEYSRKGGCFVSTGRAVGLLLGAAALATIVGVLVYYLGVVPASPPLLAAHQRNVTAPGAESSSATTPGGGAVPGDGGNISVASYRLNPRLRPLLYELTLKPFLGDGSNFSYVGHVAITLTLREGDPLDEVVLHAKGFNITADEVAITANEEDAPPAQEGNSRHRRQATVQPPHSMPLVVRQSADTARETYTVGVDPPLQPGRRYVLEMPFRGQLRESLTGFYRSSYQDNGQIKWLATTQFEATEARTAFPCFDEPAMKARFKISITHHKQYSALSNMPIARTEQLHDEPDWVSDHFAVTPEMSTYLVAFVVSEMVLELSNETLPVTPTAPSAVAGDESSPIATSASPVTQVAPNDTASSRTGSKSLDISPNVTNDTTLPSSSVSQSSVSANRSAALMAVTTSPNTVSGDSSGDGEDNSTVVPASSAANMVASKTASVSEAATAVNGTDRGTGDISNITDTMAVTTGVSSISVNDSTTTASNTSSSGTTGDKGSSSPSPSDSSSSSVSADSPSSSDSSVDHPVSSSATSSPNSDSSSLPPSSDTSPLASISSTAGLQAGTISAGLQAGPSSGHVSASLPLETTASLTPSFATAVYIPETSLQSASNTSAITGISLGDSGSSQVVPLSSVPTSRAKREANINETANSGKLEVRMLVRPLLRHQAHYALKITPQILQYYGEYFGLPYPLPKMDLAAIPDFQFGAMENWGLVTFRETQLLVGPDTTTDGLENAATTIAHELAHQWFGNLVTPTWWTDIWLNEGFATYVEYMGTNYVEPTWEMLDKVVVDQMHDVMEMDCLRSTHPVSNAVGNPAQILESFDEISYNKGSCLIRMLNHSLTEEIFRKGLTSYIQKWKYQNAKQDDLWESLEEAAKLAPSEQNALPPNGSVKSLMDSWTLQPGFPVVTAIRDYVTGSVTFNQSRFTIDGQPVPGSSSQMWSVPISYATSEEVRERRASTRPRTWLTSKSITVDKILSPGAPGSGQWLLVNLQQTGYYRVNYDATNWGLLVRQLATEPLLLPAASRAQLLSDSLALARAGALPYGTALNLTRYLRDSRVERALVPWQAFLDGTQHLEEGLGLTPTFIPLKAYLLSVLTPLLDHLGLDPVPDEVLPARQLRARVLARVLRLEAPDVTAWAQRQFAQWMAQPTNNSIPIDLRASVYCAAVMRGNEREFDFVLSQLKKSHDPAHARLLLASLACSRQPPLIAMLLNMSLAGKDIRLQDCHVVWRAVPKNPVARILAFDYMREHWTNLIKRFPDTDFPVKDILEGATDGLSTQVQLDDLRHFRDSHQGQFTYTTAAMERAIESLQEVVSWRRHFEGDVARWLASPTAAVSRSTA